MLENMESSRYRKFDFQILAIIFPKSENDFEKLLVIFRQKNQFSISEIRFLDIGKYFSEPKIIFWCRKMSFGYRK